MRNNDKKSKKGKNGSRGLAQFAYLKTDGWSSNYASVDNLLRHLTRKSKSESSRRSYLWHLYKFCQYTGKKPNELVLLRRDRVENLVQNYADSLRNAYPRYANLAIYILKTFFHVNGFKRARALELDTYHIPSRFRITNEYIPSKTEIYRMADSAGSLRDRAIILMLFGSGLRNATIRALLYRDIAEELQKDLANIMIPVYPEMKLVDTNACKLNIPYYVFTCDEASTALDLYLKDRKNRYNSIMADEPLFCSEYNQITKEGRAKKIMSARELQIIVKMAAKKANIAEWRSVHPHCLRKAFETVLHSQLIDNSNLDVKIQEFFMGHILPGSQDPYFDRSKVEWMRVQYSKLKFGRAVIENKFKVLQVAIARAFEGTDIDPEQVIEEYVSRKKVAQ